MLPNTPRRMCIAIVAVGSLIGTAGWDWQPCWSLSPFDKLTRPDCMEQDTKREAERQRKEQRERFREACSRYLAKKCSDKDVDEYRLGLLERQR